MLIVTRDGAAPIVGELCAAIKSGALPVGPAEAPAVVLSTAPAAVVVLDTPGCDDAADELTAARPDLQAFRAADPPLVAARR
ncbi:MAG: hypothetical protein HC900_12075 [Methylacidiphilales bacterium]|nr:hypothetical protein [Candidatus Methylacidiphilales bacterium]